jgi:catechol 2,3-dioxygenase-like lactoylglutathione lyase family enzyme
MLETPGFHHIMLRSVDPDAAIDFYTGIFPTTRKTVWGGMPALACTTNVLVLFEKTDTPPPTLPQSAIWHYGWHVTDTQATVKAFQKRPEVKMRPLYTTDEGGSVWASSDTWPGEAGALGRTRAEIADARARNIQPTHKAGFSYMSGGPEDALFEIAGDYPAERFNHIHMWHDDPFCALLWYKKHLNAPVRAGFPDTDLTEDTCKVPRGTEPTWPALTREGMFRTPRAGVEFDDVVLTWYANQGSEPLVSSRGQMQDHIGLSVKDIGAWETKLRGEGVNILEGAHKFGDTRAIMIEGPSREAIALVEVK